MFGGPPDFVDLGGGGELKGFVLRRTRRGKPDLLAAAMVQPRVSSRFSSLEWLFTRGQGVHSQWHLGVHAL